MTTPQPMKESLRSTRELLEQIENLSIYNYVEPEYYAAAVKGLARLALEALASPPVQEEGTEGWKMKRALDLALCWLVKHEPPDSRAVSDEYVAMASVACGNDNPECMEIIDAAIAREQALASVPSTPKPALAKPIIGTLVEDGETIRSALEKAKRAAKLLGDWRLEATIDGTIAALKDSHQ